MGTFVGSLRRSENGPSLDASPAITVEASSKMPARCFKIAE
jgi:hypothetical protein